MKHVVQFSGGLCSFFAASRVVAGHHGRKDVTLLFADTLVESAGLYRFALHASAFLQIPLTITYDGRTPWQVFADEKFIANTRVDLCSRILKRERCRKWLEQHCDPKDTTVYVGISWDENRIDEIRARWEPWHVEAPMCEPPYLTKPEMVQHARALRLPVSDAYYQGMPHDNCNGGCVKAGQAQWAKLHQIRPDVYREWEENEQEFRCSTGKDVSILRDRRGGETKPLTLAEFRTRIESDDYDKLEFGGCGCGV